MESGRYRNIALTIIALLLVVLVLQNYLKKGTPVGPGPLGSSQPIDDVPKEGLVAYYPFNGNANDESGNGNNGTNFGATPSPDRFGNSKSYNFNGIDSYIKVPNNNSLNFGSANQYSVCVWVKLLPSQNYPEGYFICTLSKAMETAGFSLGILSSKLSAEIRLTDHNGSVTNVQGMHGVGPTVVADNRWHLLTTTVDRSNTTAKTYVDTVLQANVTDGLMAQDISNMCDLYIGCTFVTQTSRDRFVKGNLDDIRIYNRALSQSEIDCLYHERGWPN